MKCGILSDVYRDGKVYRKDVWVTYEGKRGGNHYFRYLNQCVDGTVVDSWEYSKEGYSYRPVPVELISNTSKKPVREENMPFNVICDDDKKNQFVLLDKYSGATCWCKGSHSYRRIEEPKIEIDVKINGKPAKLSDISDETFRNLKKSEVHPD